MTAERLALSTRWTVRYTTRNLLGYQITHYIIHVAQLEKNGRIFTQIHLQNRPTFFGGSSVRSFVVIADLHNCRARYVQTVKYLDLII